MSDNNNDGVSIFGVLGAVLAGLMSWYKWHSIFFAIIHFLLGWCYVVYSLLRYGVPKF
jgi:hypothetical protein